MSYRVDTAVILTAEDAALLYSAANLRSLRISARGKSERLYQLLTNITHVAFSAANTSSANGTTRGTVAEPDESGNTEIVTVEQVARRAHITPRAVRNHIGLGLLDAQKVNRAWVITSQAADQYINGRRAA